MTAETKPGLYPEGITTTDHIAHDMRMGRFPESSTVEQFLAERDTPAAETKPGRKPVNPHAYAQEYEFRSDEVDYTPTEAERGMIEDAICGYLAETAASPAVPAPAGNGVREAVTLDDRMRAAGMIPLADLLAGKTPTERWMAHTGIRDIPSFQAWLTRRHEEFLRMQVGYDLGDKPKDELYEWVLAHAASFGEVASNLRQALATPVSAEEDGLRAALQVQPLDWTRPHGAETLLRAETSFGTYRTWTHHEADGAWFWEFSTLIGGVAHGGEGSSEAEVQSAVFADHESRVLRCLVGHGAKNKETIADD